MTGAAINTVAKGAATVVALSAGAVAANLASTTIAPCSSCEEREEGDRLRSWKDKWEKHELGWHLPTVNPALERFFHELMPESMQPSAPMGPRILMPLCGKTADMAWLARRGISVLGIEGVRSAVDEFAEENSVMGHSVAITIPGIDEKNFRGHAVLIGVGEEGSTRGAPPPPVIFVEGDFFKLTSEDARALVPCDAAFDRGSLVAIQPALREHYAKILTELIVPGGRVLLVVVEHDPFPDGRLGPPFEVTEQDVMRLYSNAFTIKQLGRSEVSNDKRRRECTRFEEVIYLLTKLPPS